MQFSALVSVSMICFDLKCLKNGFLWLNFSVSPQRVKEALSLPTTKTTKFNGWIGLRCVIYVLCPAMHNRNKAGCCTEMTVRCTDNKCQLSVCKLFPDAQRMYTYVAVGVTSSSPMTPAPITTILSGTLSNERAPVDEMMVFSSN